MSPSTEGQLTAEKFRSDYGLGVAPIDDIIALMDLVDVDVKAVRADGEEHGLTARDPKTGMTVFIVNSTLPVSRFRSTLAHELCHHLYAEDLTDDLAHEFTSESETRANSFARHLLLPLDAVRGIVQHRPELQGMDLLNWCVRRFGLSPTMAGYQLDRVDAPGRPSMDEYEAVSTRRLALQYGWVSVYDQRQEVVSATPPPRRLAEAAMRAHAQGRIGDAELAMTASLRLDQIPQREDPQPQADELLDLDLDLADDDLSDLR